MRMGTHQGVQRSDERDYDRPQDTDQQELLKGQPVGQNTAGSQSAQAKARAQPYHALLKPGLPRLLRNRSFFIVVKGLFQRSFFGICHYTTSSYLTPV